MNGKNGFKISLMGGNQRNISNAFVTAWSVRFETS